MKHLALAALCITVISPANAADCPMEMATYVQREAKGFFLTFRPAKEPNAWSDLEATLKTPSKDFKFTLTASNGYSFNYMVPAWENPPDDVQFHLFLFDRDLNTLDLPAKGKPAAHAILAPELGSWLHYGDNGSGGGEYLPVGMWTIGTCD